VYALLGAALWAAFLRSGVHTTIAGVLAGLVVPARPIMSRREFRPAARELIRQYQDVQSRLAELESHSQQSPEEVEMAEEMRDDQDGILGEVEELAKSTESPVERLTRAFNPWLSYVVLPLFALANAGVSLRGFHPLQLIRSPVGLGVFLGLVAGKPLGILAGTYIATRTGLGKLPAPVTWRHVVGMGLVSGMGFTVSLFIANLAFPRGAVHDVSRIAVLGASLFAGCVGYLFLRVTAGRK